MQIKQLRDLVTEFRKRRDEETAAVDDLCKRAEKLIAARYRDNSVDDPESALTVKSLLNRAKRAGGMSTAYARCANDLERLLNFDMVVK